MIKNFIFDLGGVVLKNTPSIILKNLNISIKDYDIIINKFFSNLKILDEGYMSLDDYYNLCDIPDKINKKYQNILCNYYKYREINEDIYDFMKYLKEKIRYGIS